MNSIYISDNYRIATDYFINIFGLRRSGNHFIAFSVINSFQDNVLYYSNANICPLYKQKFMKDDNRIDKRIQKKLIGESHNKNIINCVVVGVEDKSLSMNFEPLKKNINYIHYYNILIFRNTIETMISRLILNQKKQVKNYNKLTSVDNNLVDKSIEYADEYLGITQHLKNRICVNYDYIINNNKGHIEGINEKMNCKFKVDGFYSGFGRGGNKGKTFEEKYGVLNSSNRELIKKIIDRNDKLINLNRVICGEKKINSMIDYIYRD